MDYSLLNNSCICGLFTCYSALNAEKIYKILFINLTKAKVRYLTIVLVIGEKQTTYFLNYWV